MSSSHTTLDQRENWRRLKQQQRERKAKLPIDRFPAKFMQILVYFDQTKEQSQTIEHRMSDPTLAQQMRWKWYEFKKALRVQGIRPELSLAAENIILRVDASGLMQFSWRDLEPAVMDLNQMEIPLVGSQLALLEVRVEERGGKDAMDLAMETWMGTSPQKEGLQQQQQQQVTRQPTDTPATTEELDARGAEAMRKLMMGGGERE